jgi:chitinase
MDCKPGASGHGSSRCDYKSTNWSEKFYPPSRGEQYYGRGPIQLSWNYNYGSFSKVLGESNYESKMYLLEHPDEAASSGYVAFQAGLWFWMTPQSPKPSMHDVITGFWQPNSADRSAGMKTSNNGLNCFGITTNIINGGIECGNSVNKGSVNRGLYFNDWL